MFKYTSLDGPYMFMLLFDKDLLFYLFAVNLNLTVQIPLLYLLKKEFQK
jgi:hypothetical protein